MLDPRYKLFVYDTTQDAVALKASAKVAIENAFERYSRPVAEETDNSIVTAPPAKKPKRMINLTLSVNQFELTVYLGEPPVDDDPLTYWKRNRNRFPVLAKMARDYLALQHTSKDVEGNFSKGRRTIPFYRRSQMHVNSGFNLGGVFRGSKYNYIAISIPFRSFAKKVLKFVLRLRTL